MSIHHFVPRADPNVLTWEQVAQLGLDECPSEMAAELVLHDDEEMIATEEEMMIATLDGAGRMLDIRPYGPRPPAKVLAFARGASGDPKCSGP